MAMQVTEGSCGLWFHERK